MSLIYGRQRANRTDYLENSLGCEFGKPAFDTFIGVTAIVFWHTTTIPKVITAAHNDNSRLVRLCIGDG
jgi:hypothetical protein